MDRRLTGRDPLAYMGVEPSTPPQMVINKTNPTTHDGINYALGTYWLTVPQQQNKVATGLFVLISLSEGVATWDQIWPAGANQLQITTDQGGPVSPIAGALTINGGGRFFAVTDGSVPGTVSIVPDFALNAGSNGRIFIAGVSGGDWGRLNPGAGINIANDDGAITITATGGGGGGGIVTIHTDTEDVPEAGDNSVSIVGDGTFTTSLGNAGTNTVTITQVTNPTISGDTTLSGNTTLGGTITASTFTAGSLISNNTGTITSLQGTIGQVLTAQGGTTPPIWANVGPVGNILVTTYNTAGAHTWNKSANTQYVEIIAWGGGGGGGSGAQGTGVGGNPSGGSGGGGGNVFWFSTVASNVPATVTITVGAGGAGGTSITTGGAGNNGSDGTPSSFGIMSTGTQANQGSGGFINPGSARAVAGGQGGAFYTNYGTPFGAPTQNGGDSGQAGTSGSPNCNGGNSINSSSSIILPAGGGGGASGQAFALLTNFNGGNGGSTITQITNNTLAAGGAGGTTTGNFNGANGGALIANPYFIAGGAGGGGGAILRSGNMITNGSGGNGSQPGGGGGAGAAGFAFSTPTSPSGAGGRGGDGMVIVIEY